jgi:hypothetical protein
MNCKSRGVTSTVIAATLLIATTLILLVSDVLVPAIIAIIPGTVTAWVGYRMFKKVEVTEARNRYQDFLKIAEDSATTAMVQRQKLADEYIKLEQQLVEARRAINALLFSIEKIKMLGTELPEDVEIMVSKADLIYQQLYFEKSNG